MLLGHNQDGGIINIPSGHHYLTEDPCHVTVTANLKGFRLSLLVDQLACLVTTSSGIVFSDIS